MKSKIKDLKHADKGAEEFALSGICRPSLLLLYGLKMPYRAKLKPKVAQPKKQGLDKVNTIIITII